MVLQKNEIFHPKTKISNEIIDKYKSHEDKKSLGYINKIETPTSGETIFVKGKEKKTPYLVTSSRTPPQNFFFNKKS